MTRRDFQEAARRLHCVDYDALIKVGVLDENDPRWRQFRNNPTGFMIMSDDEIADKLWALITVGRPFPSERA